MDRFETVQKLLYTSPFDTCHSVKIDYTRVPCSNVLFCETAIVHVSHLRPVIFHSARHRISTGYILTLITLSQLIPVVLYNFRFYICQCRHPSNCTNFDGTRVIGCHKSYCARFQNTFLHVVTCRTVLFLFSFCTCPG